MTVRILLAALVAAVLVPTAEAGPVRRLMHQRHPSASHSITATQSSYTATSGPAGVSQTFTSSTQTTTATVSGSGEYVEALAEVNAKRAARGLRPLIPDPLLTEGAGRVAAFRAARGIDGHSPNDFSFLPPGANASSAGCAAWPAHMGWGSCCIYDNATYGGAAWVMGRDGRRFMHLFLR